MERSPPECSPPPFSHTGIISVATPPKLRTEAIKGIAHSRSDETDVIDGIKRRVLAVLNGSRTTGSIETPLTNNSPPTNTNHQQIASDFDETLYTHFRPIPVSQTKKQIYYEAPVQSAYWTAEEYSERFGYVQEELWGKVLSDKVLSDSSRDITFHLAMVGTAPRTAVPSVVIFCKSEHVKKLKTVLDPARHRLYCAKDSKAYRLFKTNPPREPPFKLEYYRTNKAVDRRAAWQIVSAGITTEGELCGAALSYGTSQAKFGITLSVNDRILSTTVDHLFSVQDNPSPIEKPDEDTLSVFSHASSQSTLIDDDVVSLDPLWSDDPDKEDLEGVDPLPTVGQGIDKKPKPPLPICLNLAKSIQGRKVDGLLDLPPSACYRDFALVQVDDKAMEALRPNTFTPTESNKGRATIRGVADKPRFNGVPVYILSGAPGVRTGRLLANYSYLGSGPERAMCKVWTLIFDGVDSLVEGECGSAVVDQETHDVYGHIVGANPMEHAYVVPFKDIIEDIKYTFTTSNVSLLGLAKLSPSVRDFDCSCPDSTRGSGPQQQKIGDFVSQNISKHRLRSTGTDVHLLQNSSYGENRACMKSTAHMAVPHSEVWDCEMESNSAEKSSHTTLPPQYTSKTTPADGVNGSSQPPTLQHTPDFSSLSSNDPCCNMIYPHASENSRTQRILSLLESSNVRSYGNGDCERNFIPISALSSILTKERVKEALADFGLPRMHASTIQSRFRQVFAILLSIGKTTLIQKFIEEGLSDSSLPLPQKSVEKLISRHSSLKSGGDELSDNQNSPQPVSSDPCQVFEHDSTLWEAFNREQWKFCAFEFKHDRHRDLQSEVILPIVERTLLRKEGFGEVYKIAIHPEYNHLTEQRGHSPSIFALKTYSSATGEELWKKEVEMYRALEDRSDIPYLAKFYGTYRHGNTYNILLEYGECGTLDDFFLTTAPPEKEDDVLRFWSGLLKLSRALIEIHHITVGDMNSRKFQERHRDIKPSDILVNSRSSRYDVTFKITDLGLADFVTPGWTQASATEHTNRRLTALPDTGSDVNLISTGMVRKLGLVFEQSSAWTLRAKSGRHKHEWSEADYSLTGSAHDAEICFGILGRVQIMTQRMLNGEIYISELLDWHYDVLKEIRRELDAPKITQPDHATKRTSDGRAIGILLDEHFSRNPVVDPHGAMERHHRSRLFRNFLRWIFSKRRCDDCGSA